MIRVMCLNCGSLLSAKDELRGQTRNCPKCSQPVRIVVDGDDDPDAVALDDAPTDQHVEQAMGDRLPQAELPTRLNRESHYLICDKTYVVATWANDGRGWMSRRGSGFISAKRNRENLPPAGDFQLVELKFVMAPEGKRLNGLSSYKLATRWALTALAGSEDEIIAKVTGPGTLNREQKSAIRLALKDQFMRDVWEGAAAVLEYLGNADYHSHSVG
jgi:hypothetical protein